MSYSRIFSTLNFRKTLPLLLAFSKFASAEGNIEYDNTTYIFVAGAITAFFCFAVALNECWYKQLPRVCTS